MELVPKHLYVHYVDFKGNLGCELPYPKTEDGLLVGRLGELRGP